MTAHLLFTPRCPLVALTSHDSIQTAEVSNPRIYHESE